MNNPNNIDCSPLFITGQWRSGTTLMSRIMNNHPNMFVTYDTVHFMRFSFNKYSPISNKNNVYRLVNDTSLRLKKRFNINLYMDDVISLIDGKYNYKSVYNAIMTSLFINKSNKIIWGEKTNLAWSKIPDFFDMFPNGRVIHIIRDPRAVLSSWKKFTHAPGNDYLDSILNSYDSMKKSIEYKSTYNNKRYISITYEELITQPETIIKKICKILEIDYYEKMHDIDSFTDIYGKKWKPNSIHYKQMAGFSKNSINKWKTDLYEWEIRLADLIVSKMYDEFNYKIHSVTNDSNLIELAINEIYKSKLATDGLLRFLLVKNGHERYPNDPIDPINWSDDI